MKILKSKINRRILISVSKIGAVFFGFLLFMGITGTFAYFSSSSSINNNTVSTGCWVKPETPQLLYPGNNYIAGSGSAWVATPYMDWSSSSTTCPLSTNIQYQYESYNDAGLTQLAYRSGLLSNSMIPAPGTPDGDYYWRVRAFDGYTWSDWSEVWLLKVDTTAPTVQITNPADSADLSGTVEIRGTVTDLHPDHYWLSIENSSGTQVAGPGTVNDTTSFADKLFFNWDTTAVADGTYTIKLEARDAFGNKNPNLAPVISDSEIAGDSVDWITVTVNNNPTPPLQTSTLFFSEYIEGNSINKALEIYNSTGSAIDLGAEGYKVEMYFNGSSSAGLTINLSGTVGNGDVFVLAQGGADSNILAKADQIDTHGWYNGNDTVVLKKGSVILDVIGQIGFAPPSGEWGSGLTSTQDNTLVRKCGIVSGDPIGNDAFDPSIQWDGYPTNDFSHLGSHNPTCPTSQAGDVVINEVMWMGSTASSGDEWIELRNTTNHDIDISNWRIDGAVTGSGGHLEIPAHYTIPANGYFLIAKYDSNNPSSALNVQADLVRSSLDLNDIYSSNGPLVLKDNSQSVIDSTPTPSSSDWPAGSSDLGINKSMERNDNPESGWHTCDDLVCNDTIYWDTEGNNYGTPDAANLSDNDPTSVKKSPAMAVVSESNSDQNTTQEENKEKGPETNKEEAKEPENSQENQTPPEEIIDNSQKDDEVLEEKKEDPALPPENQAEEGVESPEGPTD